MNETEETSLAGMVNGAWLDSQQFPPLEWIVDGILPEGFGLIVGPPKIGKSWWVGDIGLACAAGGYALGKIPVKQRPVLYLALEDGHRRLQSRFRQLLAAETPIPKGINLIVRARPNEVALMIAEFLTLHQDHAPLIILDTLGKVKPPKKSGEDSYSADYAIGTQLKDLADSVPGSCLLVVHHTRKAESSDFVDAVSGTQGIAGSADFVLLLARKRKSNDAVLSVTGRDVIEAEYALVMNDGRWTLDGMDLTDAAATVERREQQKAMADRSLEILRFVQSRPETTAKDIEAHISGISNNDAGTYLRRLYDKGHIEKVRRGVYKPVSEASEVSERYELAEGSHQGEHPDSDASDTSDADLLPFRMSHRERTEPLTP